MLDEGGLDLMVVIGGYNSSNTQALARICAERLPTYHIERAPTASRARRIRHRPGGRPRRDARARPGCPRARSRIGLTAGASTPNNVVGEVVERLLALRGLSTDALVAG